MAREISCDTARHRRSLPLQSWDIDHALAAIHAPGLPFILVCAGWFAKVGRVTSLWMGVERNQALLHFQSKIETALRRIVLAPEHRRYAPHVTLFSSHFSDDHTV